MKLRMHVTHVADLLLELVCKLEEFKSLYHSCGNALKALSTREITSIKFSELTIDVRDKTLDSEFEIFLSFMGQRHTNFKWLYNGKEVLIIAEEEYNICNVLFNLENIKEIEEKEIIKATLNTYSKKGIPALCALTEDNKVLYHINPTATYTVESKLNAFGNLKIKDYYFSELVISEGKFKDLKRNKEIKIHNKKHAEQLLKMLG